MHLNSDRIFEVFSHGHFIRNRLVLNILSIFSALNIKIMIDFFMSVLPYFNLVYKK